MPTLRWLTRDDDVRAAERVPYRLLEEVPELGYGDRDAGNMLIQGDNLEALKALLPFYAGQVKCIYIDPPFNTGQAFDDYEDNLEHSIWLQMMFPRLELLQQLLSEDGTLAFHIDDNEMAYATVLLDEVFGRKNRCYVVAFKQGAATGHKSINPGLVTTSNFILIYAKNKAEYWKPKKGFVRKPRDKRYGSFVSNFEEPFEGWRFQTLASAFTAAKGMPAKELKKELGPDGYEAELSEFVSQNAERVVRLARPDANAVGQETRELMEISTNDKSKVYLQSRDDHPDIYLKGGERILFYANKLKDIDGRLEAAEPLTTIWDDLLSNNLHNEGGVKFPKSKKPEGLVKRVFELFSDEGDLVLDSFLGSGTSAAAAMKMQRKVIGIEMGEHARALCQPRLVAVIDGERGGISKAQNWQGGGGFRFYRLGPPVFDEDGSIQSDIRFPVLAAHIWFAETGGPWTEPNSLTPFLGSDDGHGYALLYNGILGDKSVSGGNVLTRKTLAAIRAAQGDFAGPMTVFGERTALSDASLKAEKIEFKQTPYDVKARK